MQTGTHIAVDSSGDAFVTGGTGSLDFPTVNNIGPTAPVPCGVSQRSYNCPVGFILKLSPDGSQLLFSSLLGGSQASGGFEVKLNPVTGDLTVLGITNSSNFKPAPTTLQTAYSGGSCPNSNPCFSAFLLGLDPGTGALRYGSFLGGVKNTMASGLAFDASGDIYVTGSTQLPLSSSLGSVTNTYAPGGGATAGGSDVLVARLHLSGSTLTPAYITVIQGELDDGGAGIALDGSGNAYVIGGTASAHLPVTSTAFQSTYTNTGGTDCAWPPYAESALPSACGAAFVAKLNAGTGTLSFLTYLGGSNQTWGQSIALDTLGKIWLAGVTSAPDFPFSADAYNESQGFTLATPFLATMSTDGSTLPFASPIASYFGRGSDLKIDANNNVYVTGHANFAPSTPGVYAPNSASFIPVFVQKWNSGPQPVVQLSATSLTFPSTPYGGASAPQSVTLQNTGSGAMELAIQLTTATYDATLPPGFSESNNCGTSLAAGASCTITAAFQPALPSPTCLPANGCYPGSPSGVIVIQTNAATGTSTINLAGTPGHGAAVAVVPDPIVFGPQAAGTASASTYVEIQSEGDTELIVNSVSIAGPNAADFQITSNGCTNPVPLGEIGCDVQVAFSPSATATGTRTAALIVTDNAGDSPQTVPMSGLVTGPGTALIVTPGPLYLGPAAIGAPSTSSQANVTLTNPSTDTPIQVTALTFAGANAADFFTARGSCSAGSLPFTVAPGTSCFIAVQFLPLSGTHGLRTATLTLTTNPAVAGLPVIALSGDAVTNSDTGVSLISVPQPQDFGSIQVGQSSYPEQNLIAINAQAPIPCAGGATTCGGPLTISSFATGLSDYQVVSLTSEPYCTNPPLTIPAGNYGCTFEILFSPSAVGNRNTTLSINSNDPMGPTIIPLFGTGLALPLGNVSATQLNFGSSAIGVASLPMSFTLLNVGQTNLSVSSVTATAPFSVASNGCPSSLAPNAACTISAAFTPPTAGPFTGTLTITDNDTFDAQQTVALSGTGATGPYLRLSTTSINFGNQLVNTASDAQTVTLANTGDTTISFPTNALSARGDYILQDTSCGSSLAPRATCVINLQFKPVVDFSDPGILLVTDSAPGSPQAVDLMGSGTTSASNPTITLTSSANPTAQGLPVTFTATVAGTNGQPVPTGTVSFYDAYGTIGTMPLNSNGQASVTTTLVVGTYFVNAIYNGSSNYNSVSSSVLTETVYATSNNATATALISSTNPSAFGQTVVFTAAVTPTGSGSQPSPTGNVMFLDGTTTIGMAALNGAAQALLQTSSLSLGSHNLSAMYAGSAIYNGSTSSTLVQVVNAATGTATTTSLAPSANPASSGQPVVFTATVSGAGGTPTGTVTFLSGATVLGSTLLNGGQASFASGAFAAGAYSITAVYGGDATYAGSTSAVLNETATSPPYIWLANGDQTLSRFGVTGLIFSPPAGYSGGGLSAAVDAAGNIWSGGSGSVTMLNSYGAGAQTFTGGGIATPVSIGIAGDGSVWIANTNSTVATLANSGSALSPASGYNGGGLDSPTGLAIDGSGNVWVSNAGDSSLTEFVGAASPVVTPLAAAVKNNNQGGQP